MCFKKNCSKCNKYINSVNQPSDLGLPKSEAMSAKLLESVPHFFFMKYKILIILLINKNQIH